MLSKICNKILPWLIPLTVLLQHNPVRPEMASLVETGETELELLPNSNSIKHPRPMNVRKSDRGNSNLGENFMGRKFEKEDQESRDDNEDYNSYYDGSLENRLDKNLLGARSDRDGSVDRDALRKIQKRKWGQKSMNVWGKRNFLSKNQNYQNFDDVEESSKNQQFGGNKMAKNSMVSGGSIDGGVGHKFGKNRRFFDSDSKDYVLSNLPNGKRRWGKNTLNTWG